MTIISKRFLVIVSLFVAIISYGSDSLKIEKAPVFAAARLGAVDHCHDENEFEVENDGRLHQLLAHDDANAHLNIVQQKNMELVCSKAKELSEKITEKSEALKIILSDYQTQNVTSYEIERSIRTLSGLSENSAYLDADKKIDSASIMLPSNLPLYSLVTHLTRGQGRKLQFAK